MAPEKKTTSAPLDDAEEKLEKGLALILSALPTLLIRWIKKKKK